MNDFIKPALDGGPESLSPSASNPLVIKEYKKTHSGQTTRISASVDGFEVFFEGDCLADAPERADAFLAVGLLQAMFQHRTLDLRALPPLSSGLLQNMREMQDIWCCWNSRLHHIDIQAHAAVTPAGFANLAFFSGDVNTVHMALSLGAQAGRLVFIDGFDFAMTATEFDAAHKRVAGIAALLDRELLAIRTNWITYTRNMRIARATSHGTCLAAIAGLLNPAQAYIASSTSWVGMHPWGTHPFLDKLWSSDQRQVYHYGKDATRLEKLGVISERPELFKHLRVCHEQALGNCGRCPECIRTHATLTMIGADTSAFPAAQGDVVKAWLLMESADPTDRVLLEEALVAVKVTGRADLLKILSDGKNNALRRRVMRMLWRRLLPGVAARHDASNDLLPWGSGPCPDL